jgi:glycosyltransferase involved in cell wall biosynthesis
MIVGMMFCKNEADVLPMTITDAMRHVDSLFISDDGSTDKSWDIIQYYRQKYPSKIEHVQQHPDSLDQGQRSSMLNLIRSRYKPEDTWVQIIDADMLLHTDNLSETIVRNSRADMLVNWYIMNAVRDHWEGVHQWYPNWPEDLRVLMPKFHILEQVTYTFRPMPALYYTTEWKPWPKGFTKYVKDTDERPNPTRDTVPILLHYGYRGPTHVFSRLGGRPKDKYGQEYDSIPSILHTFNCFNGKYNRSPLARMDPREAWEAGL